MLVEKGNLGLGIKHTARVVPTAQVLGTLELFNGVLGRLKLRCSHDAGLKFELWFGFRNGRNLGFGVRDGHGLFNGFKFRLEHKRGLLELGGGLGLKAIREGNNQLLRLGRQREPGTLRLHRLLLLDLNRLLPLDRHLCRLRRRLVSHERQTVGRLLVIRNTHGNRDRPAAPINLQLHKGRICTQRNGAKSHRCRVLRSNGFNGIGLYNIGVVGPRRRRALKCLRLCGFGLFGIALNGLRRSLFRLNVFVINNGTVNVLVPSVFALGTFAFNSLKLSDISSHRLPCEFRHLLGRTGRHAVLAVGV